jgi:hypothetical protein
MIADQIQSLEMKDVPMTSKPVSLKTIRRVFFLLVGVALLAPAGRASADIGPHSTMNFEFAYEIDPSPTIISGQMQTCVDAACQQVGETYTAAPLFGCDAAGCSSLYTYQAPYYRLSIQFSDGKTRQSNVFAKANSSGSQYYRVAVRADDLVVTPLPQPIWQNFWPALGLTLAIEGLVAVVYLALFRLPRKALIWVLVGNLVSLPAVWLASAQLGGVGLWLGEIGAVVFEAGLLYLASRRALSIGHAALVSLAMNGISFLAGLALTWLQMF